MKTILQVGITGNHTQKQHYKTKADRAEAPEGMRKFRAAAFAVCAGIKGIFLHLFGREYSRTNIIESRKNRKVKPEGRRACYLIKRERKHFPKNLSSAL